MAEEFQESEVIFQENVVNEDDDVVECRVSRNIENPKRKKKKITKNSIPVAIPDIYSGNKNPNPWVECVELNLDLESDGEIVPPHVIVGRRRIFAGKMAFSVCSGKGRTLKGRDLSRVRNCILRMTGFLET